MSNEETSEPDCAIDEPHCRSCGSTDWQDIDSSDGYSKCCGKPTVTAWNCKGYHLQV